MSIIPNQEGIEQTLENNIFASVKSDVLRFLLKSNNIVRTIASHDTQGVDNPYKYTIIEHDVNDDTHNELYYLSDPQAGDFDEKHYLIDNEIIVRPALLHRRIIPHLSSENTILVKDSQVDTKGNFIFFDIIPDRSTFDSSAVSQFLRYFTLNFVIYCDKSSEVISVYNDFLKSYEDTKADLNKQFIAGEISQEEYNILISQLDIDNKDNKTYIRDVGTYNLRTMYLFSLVRDYFINYGDKHLGISGKTTSNAFKPSDISAPTPLVSLSGHFGIAFKIYCEYIDCPR